MRDTNEIIGIVFSCDGNRLSDDDTPESVLVWDSMTHIILLSSLEEEFDISFSDDEMVTIRTIGEIRKKVSEKSAGHLRT